MNRLPSLLASTLVACAFVASAAPSRADGIASSLLLTLPEGPLSDALPEAVAAEATEREADLKFAPTELCFVAVDKEFKKDKASVQERYRIEARRCQHHPMGDAYEKCMSDAAATYTEAVKQLEAQRDQNLADCLQ